MPSATTVRRPSVLDLYLGTAAVKGQEIARKQMATLLARQGEVAEGLHEAAPGALIAGRSGSGKTMLARMMCRMSGLPFSETNATRYTEAGYAGLDLNKMFLPLMESAAQIIDAEKAPEDREQVPNVLARSDIREVVALAQKGVVLLDEFDKWMLRINHVTGEKDMAIQADLLKMIEGCEEYVSDNEDEVGVLFDTTRVLILCAGAFVRLPRLVAKRIEKEESDVTLWDQITQEDFVAYGVLPELAGRLATHIFLRPLRMEHLVDILMAEDGLASEYQRRFEAVGCEWDVGREGLQKIAELALRRETGARAVDHIMFKVFGEALFEASVAEHPSRVHFDPTLAKAVVA